MSSAQWALFFGTYDMQRHPRVEVLAQGLERRGWRVSHVNVPSRLGTANRVRILRQPWTATRALLRIVAAWTKLWANARAVDSDPDVVVVGYLGTLDVHLASWLFGRKSPIVLDDLAPLSGTAADRGAGHGYMRRLLELLDREARDRADLVLVDTDEHRRDDWDVVVPVGATSNWFEAGDVRDEESGEPLRVVFFGLFTPLQGAAVIARAIRRIQDPIHVTLVGDGQDYPEVARILESDPRVRHVPWVEAESLPDVVAAHDVCLGIFGNTAKARRVVPNKVYQGMAAGCAVITSRTPPQVRALDDAVRFVEPGAPRELARAICEMADPEVLSAWKSRARQHAEASFRPEQVVRPLERGLREWLAHHDLGPLQAFE